MAERKTELTNIDQLSDSDLINAIKRAWQGMNFDAGDVALLLVEVAHRQCWPKEFATFRQWVTGAPPRGLGRDPDVLLGIMHRSHLPGIEWELLKLLKAPHGGDRRSKEAQEEIKSHNITLDRGTSGPYSLLRLAKKRPDLHARVLQGELTAHAAMLEAKLRRPMLQVRADDVDHAMRKLIDHYGLDPIISIIIELQKDGRPA